MTDQNKDIIKYIIKFKGTYDFEEYKNICKKIYKKLDKKHDEKTIKSIVSSYVSIKKNKINIDDIITNKYTYNDIKKKISISIIDNVQKEIPVISKGGFMKNYNNNDNDNDNNNDHDINNNDNDINNNDIIIVSDKKISKKGGFMKKYKNSDEENTITNNNNISTLKKEVIINNNTKNKDDNLSKDAIRRRKIYDNLASIDYPEQRSKRWFEQREGSITASDAGCPIGENHYEHPYRFYLKKLGMVPFESNINCYNGKKYESVSTMIYEYRNDVSVTEFGLVVHPKYSFLAASPDGIVSPYKMDRIHLTEQVGTMLEIKCPRTRKIKKNSSSRKELPYYWVQVQNQLECCNLDSCAFWQTNIVEYSSKQEFINDSNDDKEWLSKSTGNEKGCVIQILPQNKIKDFIIETLDHNGNTIATVDENKYLYVVYEYSKHIYLPKIEMSLKEIDEWILNTLENLKDTHNGYSFDKIFYWKLDDYDCEIINRDTLWFNEHLPKFKNIWDNVLFFRNNETAFKMFCDYIDSINVLLVNKVKNILFNKNKTLDDVNYVNLYLTKIIKSINNNNETKFIEVFKNKYVNSNGKFYDFNFCDKIEEYFDTKIMSKIKEMQKK
jgi:putative phage-type endonuclease